MKNISTQSCHVIPISPDWRCRKLNWIFGCGGDGEALSSKSDLEGTPKGSPAGINNGSLWTPGRVHATWHSSFRLGAGFPSSLSDLTPGMGWHRLDLRRQLRTYLTYLLTWIGIFAKCDCADIMTPPRHFAERIAHLLRLKHTSPVTMLYILRFDVTTH